MPRYFKKKFFFLLLLSQYWLWTQGRSITTLETTYNYGAPPPFLSGTQAFVICASPRQWLIRRHGVSADLSQQNKQKLNWRSFWGKRKCVVLVVPHRQLETHFSMNLSCLQQQRLTGPFETYWTTELTSLKSPRPLGFLLCELNQLLYCLRQFKLGFLFLASEIIITQGCFAYRCS